ncbi:MAG: hypothetical protein AABZ74_09645 [Cyanobacteriota bacterium]
MKKILFIFIFIINSSCINNQQKIFELNKIYNLAENNFLYFNNKNYKVNSYFHIPYCPYPEGFLPYIFKNKCYFDSKYNNNILIKIENINGEDIKELIDNFKVSSIFILSKENNYYFETSDVIKSTSYDKRVYLISYIYDNDIKYTPSKNDYLILKLISNQKEFYIKSDLTIKRS